VVARRGESRGERQVKTGERPKMFPPSVSITFFGKFSIFCNKFSDEVSTENLFFAFHACFSVFQEDFPVTFAPKWKKMTFSTLGSKPRNGRKHTLKWEKRKSKFSKVGGYPPPPLPPSRRH